MGRLDPVKRLEWIIDVASNLKNSNFTIYGPLSGYSDFNSELSNVNIIKKTYIEEDFIEQSKTHGIYLLTSVRESFGMTMLEAMGLGLIVVSSNTKGANEHITNGKNGFIVNSEVELSDIIKDIQNEVFDIQEIRKNGIEYAKNFCNRGSGILNIYSELLK